MGGPDDMGGKITKEGWLYKRGILKLDYVSLAICYIEITYNLWYKQGPYNYVVQIVSFCLYKNKDFVQNVFFV